MDIIVSFSTVILFTKFNSVNMVYMGEPYGYTFRLGKSRVYKITYEDITTGQEIWYISSQYTTNTIKH